MVVARGPWNPWLRVSPSMVAPSVVMRRRMVFWLSPLASSATGVRRRLGEPCVELRVLSVRDVFGGVGDHLHSCEVDRPRREDGVDVVASGVQPPGGLYLSVSVCICLYLFVGFGGRDFAGVSDGDCDDFRRCRRGRWCFGRSACRCGCGCWCSVRSWCGRARWWPGSRSYLDCRGRHRRFLGVLNPGSAPVSPV